MEKKKSNNPVYELDATSSPFRAVPTLCQIGTRLLNRACPQKLGFHDKALLDPTIFFQEEARLHQNFTPGYVLMQYPVP